MADQLVTVEMLDAYAEDIASVFGEKEDPEPPIFPESELIAGIPYEDGNGAYSQVLYFRRRDNWTIGAGSLDDEVDHTDPAAYSMFFRRNSEGLFKGASSTEAGPTERAMAAKILEQLMDDLSAAE
jgi:hypothetical protein